MQHREGKHKSHESNQADKPRRYPIKSAKKTSWLMSQEGIKLAKNASNNELIDSGKRCVKL